MLAAGYDPHKEEVAKMLIKHPGRYFCYGGTDMGCLSVLIERGPAFFKDSFLGNQSLAWNLVLYGCSSSLREILSWSGRDDFIEERKQCLSFAICSKKHDCAVLLVDSGIDFYSVRATILGIYDGIPSEKRLLMRVMRRVHCKRTVWALLGVKKMGMLRNQDRFVIQRIAFAMWTTRWKWEWNQGGARLPGPGNRFFESPLLR